MSAYPADADTKPFSYLFIGITVHKKLYYFFVSRRTLDRATLISACFKDKEKLTSAVDRV